MKTTASTVSRADGFSLVEVTIAIGIFAFVVVGVLGLFPTAMKMRRDASMETRAVMVAQELYSALRAAPGMDAVELRDGPGLKSGNNQTVRLRSGDTVVVGYPPQSSVPFFLWGGERNIGSPDTAWTQGQMPQGAVDNAIEMLAKISATNLTANTNLFLVTVQVRSPASMPLDKTRPVTFTSLIYSP
jgi:type II secretory pathway pseudopilin PulG